MLGLNRLLGFLTSIELLMVLLWLGLAIFTVALTVLLYTRWGQYKPLRKCMVLSVFAHLLMAGYATTVEIVSPMVRPAEPVIYLSISDDLHEAPSPGSSNASTATVSKTSDTPWEAFPSDAVAQPKEAELERAKAGPPAEPERRVRAELTSLRSGPAVDHVALPDAKPAEVLATTVALVVKRAPTDESATRVEAPASQRRESPQVATPDAGSPERLATEASPLARESANDTPAALLEQIVPLPKMSDAGTIEPFVASSQVADSARLKSVDRIAGRGGDDDAYGNGNGTATGGDGSQGGAALVASNVLRPDVPDAARSRAQQPVPDAYRLRIAPDRESIAQSRGGSAETEAAVKAGLKWLADNQSADGRWDPRIHGAGNETNVLGRDRQKAGSHADTAMTGLALLAFLASGHTHLDGPYQEDIRRGLEFLIQSQSPDGNLGGEAVAFEFMYCHAMATCALSEAYGLTRDQRLREPVRRAIRYTVAAQDPKGGGWRYKPGDAGDTSQLGWQLMSLKSAELAGIPMSETTRQGAIRFLRSVSSGRYGGLASYRPGEPATQSMTAEALVCWQFLGLDREHPACNEAGDSLMANLPGDGTYNLYYWYYATLGMYQLQDAHWRRWNEAIRSALVSRQVKEGPLAGSWDTGDLWGGHGGRVYTTAMAALTLEVYYRFLPIYGGTAANESRDR